MWREDLPSLTRLAFTDIRLQNLLWFFSFYAIEKLMCEFNRCACKQDEHEARFALDHDVLFLLP
jgi:hypothetical protein